MNWSRHEAERLRNGERDIDVLVEQARERVIKTGELTRTEVDELTRAVRRDLEEFAMSYEESLKEESDSIFMRVIKESLCRSWQTSPIKRSLNGVKFSRISIITGFITAEKWSGWGIWSARNVTSISRSTPEVLTLCPKCGHDQFQRRPFEP